MDKQDRKDKKTIVQGSLKGPIGQTLQYTQSIEKQEDQDKQDKRKHLSTWGKQEVPDNKIPQTDHNSFVQQSWNS